MDEHAQQLLTELAIVNPNAAGYSLVEGLIRHKQKIWLGANSALQTKIISAFHASAVGGHSEVQATYQRVHKLFSWPGLKATVKSFVRQCAICQQAKHEHCKSPGLLSPLPIPSGAWQDLSMDFIEGLPKVNVYSIIYVVVDRFTKYAHFIAIKHPFIVASVATVFFDSIVKLHGKPKTIVSHRDKVFITNFWQELFKLMKTKLNLSSAYHPQTDGQTECVNQCIEMFLCSAICDTPKEWLKWLPMAEFWYNSTYHSAIHCSHLA